MMKQPPKLSLPLAGSRRQSRVDNCCLAVDPPTKRIVTATTEFVWIKDPPATVFSLQERKKASAAWVLTTQKHPKVTQGGPSASGKHRATLQQLDRARGTHRCSRRIAGLFGPNCWGFRIRTSWKDLLNMDSRSTLKRDPFVASLLRS